MAFIEPATRDRADAQEHRLPGALKKQLAVRTAALEKLSKVADASLHAAPGEPPLWEAALEAVAHYRHHQKVTRQWIEVTAGYVIKAGAPSGPTCDRFGIGRATMQQLMAGRVALAMLTDAKPQKGESDGTAA